ncbi:MAG: hypothetical protein AVDCRST_MAG57-3139, partial [uncultured Blastococcus sp.]
DRTHRRAGADRPLLPPQRRRAGQVHRGCPAGALLRMAGGPGVARGRGRRTRCRRGRDHVAPRAAAPEVRGRRGCAEPRRAGPGAVPGRRGRAGTLRAVRAGRTLRQADGPARAGARGRPGRARGASAQLAGAGRGDRRGGAQQALAASPARRPDGAAAGTGHAEPARPPGRAPAGLRPAGTGGRPAGSGVRAVRTPRHAFQAAAQRHDAGLLPAAGPGAQRPRGRAPRRLRRQHRRPCPAGAL